MTSWMLGPGIPAQFHLSADARLSQTDYCNDQTWEITLRGGEPPALAAQTTFGLRARLMRLFPVFAEGTVAHSAPASFDLPPEILQAYPNFLTIAFSPFTDIDVLADYWVPESQVIAGRFEVTNRSETPRSLRLELVAQLTPLGDGHAMAPLQVQVASILHGRTGDLAPVLFMTGAPEAMPSPYPSLVAHLDLDPGETRRLSWALAALREMQSSFDLARRTTARPWQAELTRIELQNHHDQFEITTGLKTWDTAFALSQRQALRLCLDGGPGFPGTTFVSTRTPDQGYSPHNGLDYGDTWNGQTVFEMAALFQAAPGASDLAKQWLRNFLAAQSEDGSIDSRPGPAGQRSHLAAPPALASLAWRIYQSDADRRFIQDTFQPLYRFLWNWFSPARDRDRDGIPEWDHPQQTGLDELPLFDRWHPWGQGLEISTVESPGLTALLYRECRCLANIAQELERPEPIPGLTALAEHLKASLDAGWDAGRPGYTYRDRDTHASPPAQEILHWRGLGERRVEQDFNPPRRLIVTLRSPGSSTSGKASLTLVGKSPQGEVSETLTVNAYRWEQAATRLTTGHLFSHLEAVITEEAGPDDEVILTAAGYDQDDLSLLLPLWAEIPSPAQAAALLEKSLENPERYGLPFGLPACPDNPETLIVHLFWNALIAEGLVSYGYRPQAANLFTKCMEAVVQSLSTEGYFRKAYDAQTGAGLGERDILPGLIPLGTFLTILGIQQVTPRRIILRENNPFPWPVTVKYQGITIHRDTAHTKVTFADGQECTVGPGDHVLSLE